MDGTIHILVTGANGQLGMEFRALAAHFPKFGFIFAGKEMLSIDDKESIHHFFKENRIGYCINCAAYTMVDKAESDRDTAIHINATAVGELAAACKIYGAGFIHFSTDYVFNGEANKPYTEGDATDPVNFYGLTKLMGERAALENNPETIIIRTSWVYSSYGKNFVKTMLRLMSEKESIGVVADQFGSPTYAADLAAAVMQAIVSGNNRPGIYHYCNEGIISWHEFATAIKTFSGSGCIVNAIGTAAYPTPAKRPHFSALNTQKIKDVFQLQIPGWKESLQRCMDKLSV